MATASGPTPGPTTTSAHRGRPWRTVLLIGILLLPIAEIAALVAAGRSIGLWWTIGLLTLMSLAGAWLMRREGLATWRSFRRTAESGQVPGTEAVDAALVVVGGFLLLLPGFVTDLAGLFLLLPLTRRIARRSLQRGVERRVMAHARVVPSVLVDEQPDPGLRQIPHIDLRPERDR